MIDLKSRQMYINFKIAQRFILLICAQPLVIWGVVQLILSIINGINNVNFQQIIFVVLTCIVTVVNAFFTLAGCILKNKMRYSSVTEFFKIVNNAKIVNSPKVVYVYTCHNDLIESRVLQNSQQTYKNFEVWISDGSNNPDISNKIKVFALEHNFNYFKVGPEGSINKADNLNTFLNKSGAKFDYLLITDSDEALNNHFVEYALKCFYSPKFRNLGYVTPLNYYYESESLFSNTLLNQLNVICWMHDYTKTLTTGNIGNLYSASCLISNKLITKNNNSFPSGCLEDYFMEHFAIINGFSGIIIPISPCGQECDKNIHVAINRNFRVVDWQICLFKKGILSPYNEKYSGWYRSLVLVVASVPLVILLYIAFPWLVLFICCFGYQLFSNPIFITILCSVLFQLICLIVGKSIGVSKKTILNKYGLLSVLFIVLYGLSALGPLFSHWWNALIRGKYVNFVSSGKLKKQSFGIKKIVLLLLINTLLIAVFNTLFIMFVGFTNIWFILLFTYVEFLLAVILLSSGSFLILHFASKKIVNHNFSYGNFIYPPKFYQFENIRKKILNEGADND